MTDKKDRPEHLNDRYIKSIKEPGVYTDGPGGHGLRLLVTKRVNGEFSKRFQQNLTASGNKITVPIGAYPVVSLKEAREKALTNVRLALDGTDPRPNKKDKKNVPTFAEAVDLLIAEKHWRHSTTERLWRGRLKKHALPKIGHKRVNEITEDDIIAVLKSPWDAGKTNTAKELLGYIRQIMVWCRRNKHRDDSPVTEYVRDYVKGTRKVNHIRSVPYYQVGEALQAIRRYGGEPYTKLAQEFQILTAARHISIRKARWKEIDWEHRIWTSPAEHMKTEQAHRVPLSTGAVSVLQMALLLKREDSDLIFPSRTGGLIKDGTLRSICKKLHLPGTPHGFRASFATWCAEKGVPQELAEAALAHKPNAIVRAYTRSDYLERRKPLMQAWSDHIEGKLADNWMCREGDEALLEALRESQRLFADAQDELVKLRTELATLMAA